MRKRFARSVLRQGVAAYFSPGGKTGLVPCSVLSVFDDKEIGVVVRVKFTSTRGVYRRGEVAVASVNMVYPRDAVYTKNYMPQVRPYDVVKDAA